jgi:hypothetical protein
MQVRISKPTKSAMQSADGDDSWLLEFVTDSNSKFKEKLMGRTSSSDMSNEIKIRFSTLEEAVTFAEKKSYPYEIIKQKKPKIPKKNYASNFS